MVQKLWKKLKEILLEQNISSELSIMDAFLGISASNLVNLICVVVKQYIYFCRCKNITPIVEVMLNRIKEVKNIEYKIASVNDTVTKHSKKWTLIILIYKFILYGLVIENIKLKYNIAYDAKGNQYINI